ncbi:unnamed protein product [Protopolystoma xenopodis]|uniref:Uncharacterized protein n=1 Tax=Protopolystoma xenopodis TaxID=117903 RepID=A0A448WDD8_9PLAT|nr:unnamed protein product [Protopolystoma xenopodis]
MMLRRCSPEKRPDPNASIRPATSQLVCQKEDHEKCLATASSANGPAPAGLLDTRSAKLSPSPATLK